MPITRELLRDAARLEALTPREAVQLQRAAAARVRLTPLAAMPRLIGGADVSHRRGDRDLYAAIVVWDRETNEIVDSCAVARPARFPYVPGLLSFREIPAVVEAWAGLATPPGLLLCDGQGYAHPRRFGLACHLGVTLDVSTVGCAKTRFIGAHDEPGAEPGARAALYDRDDLIGWVLRSRRGSRPLYVSPGHRCDFAGAVTVVNACLRGYRLPEPTRRAHLAVNAARLNRGRGDRRRAP